MTARKRILLVDDHPVVLVGLRSIIEAETDLEIAGTASNGLDALKIVRESTIDVAIVDISMPALSGIGLLRRLAETGIAVRVLIYSLQEDRAHVNHALQAGARGYMLKRTASETAIAAIRAVLAGGIYIDPAIADQMFAARSAAARPPTLDSGNAALTAREDTVLRLAAKGHSNKEIAGRFDISVKSVETYKARGLDKLGLRTRVELIRYASTCGWLSDFS